MDVRVGCVDGSSPTVRYYERFDTIEVQQTFYSPPRVATLEGWRAEAPPRFEFTMKAWQLVTHEATSPTYRRLKEPVVDLELTRYGAFRATSEVRMAWEVTAACARALAAQVVVFQTPASFRPTRENVRSLWSFFDSVREQVQGARLGWETRGGLWPENLVRGLCRGLDVDHIVDPFLERSTTEGLRYYRLHGGRDYAHKYTDEELEQVARWCEEVTPTWCLFNNRPALDDATRFLQLIGRDVALTPVSASPSRTTPPRGRRRPPS